MTLSRALVSAGMIAAALTTTPAPSSADQGWPARVHATYEVRFNGIKIGSFDFDSTTDQQRYNMTTSGKVAILLGAMKWSSHVNAKGQLAGSAVRPEEFDFDLKGSTKAGTTKMQFTGNTISKVEMTPASEPKPGNIPVEPHHLKNVFDPFSAVMAMTQGGANPCSRKIPVYDGKRRIDILLQPKGEVDLPNAKPSDQPTTGVICRVNYKLIAGHKPGDENTYMNKNQHIDMTLRPIPQANIYVPYQVTASTLLGNITIFAKSVTITQKSNQQIVLAH